MDAKELMAVLVEHKKWLDDFTTGDRANLRGANLRGADLRSADLRDANLSDADLSSADLSDAKTNYTTIGHIMACPETGAFEGWKKAEDKNGKPIVIKLLIPARSKRSSATTRKCRAEYVRVLQGNGRSAKGAIYKQGTITRCDKWDPCRWNECSGGIHFFMNKADAESWE
jgi:hypothetical protein